MRGGGAAGPSRAIFVLNASSPNEQVRKNLKIENSKYGIYMYSLLFAATDSADTASKLVAQIAVWALLAACFGKFFHMVFAKKPGSKDSK